MNKFLAIIFKIGKIFSSILLVIILFVMLQSTVNLLTMGNTSLKTPKFETLKNIFDEYYENTNSNNQINRPNTKPDKTTPYINQITKIVHQNHLSDGVQYLIVKNINNDIDSKLIDQYLKGLNNFYKDGLEQIEKSQKFAKNYVSHAVISIEGYGIQSKSTYKYVIENIKRDDIYDYHIGECLTNDYHRFFKNAINIRNEQIQKNSIEKRTQQIILTVSILLFAIFLFLPVLLKIEENTRPKEETNEDTKSCINCGKQIKIGAKKCRFCDTWQTEVKDSNGGNE